MLDPTTATIQQVTAELVLAGIPKVDPESSGEGLLSRAFSLRAAQADHWTASPSEVRLVLHGEHGCDATVHCDADGRVTGTELWTVETETEAMRPLGAVPGWHGLAKTKALAAQLEQLVPG